MTRRQRQLKISKHRQGQPKKCESVADEDSQRNANACTRQSQPNKCECVADKDNRRRVSASKTKTSEDVWVRSRRRQPKKCKCVYQTKSTEDVWLRRKQRQPKTCECVTQTRTTGEVWESSRQRQPKKWERPSSEDKDNRRSASGFIIRRQRQPCGSGARWLNRRIVGCWEGKLQRPCCRPLRRRAAPCGIGLIIQLQWYLLDNARVCSFSSQMSALVQGH